jgi:hypothetical protein
VTAARSGARLDFLHFGATVYFMVSLLLSNDRRVALGRVSRLDGESAPQG